MRYPYSYVPPATGNRAARNADDRPLKTATTPAIGMATSTAFPRARDATPMATKAPVPSIEPSPVTIAPPRPSHAGGPVASEECVWLWLLPQLRPVVLHRVHPTRDRVLHDDLGVDRLEKARHHLGVTQIPVQPRIPDRGNERDRHPVVESGYCPLGAGGDYRACAIPMSVRGLVSKPRSRRRPSGDHRPGRPNGGASQFLGLPLVEAVGRIRQRLREKDSRKADVVATVSDRALMWIERASLAQ